VVFIENGKKKYVFLLAGVILAFLLILIFWGISFFEKLQKNKIAEISLPENVSSFVEVANESTEVVAEKDIKIDITKDNNQQINTVLSSENFKIRDVRFGGSVATASGNDESIPLEALEIKGSTVSSTDKKDNKVLISWKTNKMAISTVEYSKNDSGVPMKFNETGFGFNHGLVLSGLEPGTRYVYVIKSRDRWGNESISDKYAVYISNPVGSIVDVIMKEINEIFGWAVKK